MISNIGFILLAIYLILIGVTGIVSGFTIPPIVLAIIALVSGILILIGR